MANLGGFQEQTTAPRYIPLQPQRVVQNPPIFGSSNLQPPPATTTFGPIVGSSGTSSSVGNPSPVLASNNNGNKQKVPVWQTWWFWVIIGAIIVALVLIIVLSVIYGGGGSNNNDNVITSLNPPPTLCNNSGEQVPLFIQLEDTSPNNNTSGNPGGYAFMSTQRSVPGATVQREGQPELLLCASDGESRIPLYAYVNNKDPADTRWGTVNIPPSYYELGNDGLPIGYLYTMNNIRGTTVKPVYELVHDSNNDLTHTGIVSHNPGATIGGIVYSRTSNTPLGYSL